MIHLLSKDKFNINLKFFKNKDKQQQEILKEKFNNAIPFLKVLEEELNNLIQSKIRESESRLSYKDMNNWAYYQADIAGYKRALRDIIRLFINRNYNDNI